MTTMRWRARPADAEPRGRRHRSREGRRARGHLPRRHARPRASGGRSTASTARSRRRRRASSVARCGCPGTATRWSRPTRSPDGCARGCRAELGDGGPGFVFVVAPHRFVGARGDDALDERRLDHRTRSRRSQVADGLYGPGGSSAETRGGGATIKLVAGKVSNVELYYLAQPHGGTATITGDGAEADASRDQRRTPSAGLGGGDDRRRRGEVRRSRPRVACGCSASTSRTPSGAVVDNLGIVSVNVKSFANHDEAHWTAELAHRNADLVMVMIGANEAQWLGPGDKDTKAYAANYEQGARADPQGAARARASSCRRPIRPRPRTARTRRAR